MKLSLSIECDNSAFDDNPGCELARILRTLSAQLSGNPQVGEAGKLFDANGNACGEWKVEASGPNEVVHYVVMIGHERHDFRGDFVAARAFANTNWNPRVPSGHVVMLAVAPPSDAHAGEALEAVDFLSEEG